MKVLLVAALVILTVSCGWAEDEVIGENGDDSVIHSAVIESCNGWRLNRLPKVREFLREDFEVLYDNTKFKKIPGKSPILKLYNQHGEEVESMDIAHLSRQELNRIMEEKGIPKKADHDGSEL